MLSYSYSIGDRTEGSVSRAELVAGMQLLRAVNMQSIRLQLAVLRHEQKPTIESLDSLADMDRELEHFIEGIGPAGLAVPELRGIAELVALQKRALANEKIALMAGISGPKLAGAPAAAVEAEIAVPVDTVAPDAAEAGYPAPNMAGRVLTAAALSALTGVAVAGWLFVDVIAATLGL